MFVFDGWCESKVFNLLGPRSMAGPFIKQFQLVWQHFIEYGLLFTRRKPGLVRLEFWTFCLGSLVLAYPPIFHFTSTWPLISPKYPHGSCSVIASEERVVLRWPFKQLEQDNNGRRGQGLGGVGGVVRPRSWTPYLDWVAKWMWTCVQAELLYKTRGVRKNEGPKTESSKFQLN